MSVAEPSEYIAVQKNCSVLPTVKSGGYDGVSVIEINVGAGGGVVVVVVGGYEEVGAG